MNRKGLYLTLDAVFAILLLVSTVLLLSYIDIGTTERSVTDDVTQDVLLSLEAMTLGDAVLQYPEIAAIMLNTSLDENDTVLYAIGLLWTNNDSRIDNLTQILADNIPEDINFRLYADSSELYVDDTGGLQQALSVAVQQVTGISEGEPIAGTTSSAHLRKIRDKRTSSFAYYGGFVGQGNITTLMTLPASLNTTDILDIEMEFDAAEGFNLLVNMTQCGSTFYPNSTADNFTPDTWNITSCSGLFSGGENQIEVHFVDTINEAYIGGGFIKITYLTDDFQEADPIGSATKELPGIDGIINLYDGLRVPGDLLTMDLYLHYETNRTVSQNYSFYASIGNTTVWFDVSTTDEQTVTVPDVTLATLLNYTQMSNDTVPIRIGFDNLTFSTSYQGNADVMIVTDVSGSMRWRMDQDSVNGAIRACTSSAFNDSDTERLSVAKCLDQQFVQDILNYSGNRLGLVSYQSSTDESDSVPLTINQTLLNDTIDQYSAGGGTCVCCGVNSARNRLTGGHVVLPIIEWHESWLYTDQFLNSTPPNDAENDTWYDPDYSFEGTWSTGNTILGADNAEIYAPTINTSIGSNLTGTEVFVDLWENVGDVSGAPVDFGSGVLNSTANTYGYSGSDDGWDKDDDSSGSGPFGYDDHILYQDIVGGELQFTNQDTSGNQCNGRDCSGAYGITIAITSQLNKMLQQGGTAQLTFDYAWESDNNRFEDGDQMWVKARLSTPTGVQTYLGTDADQSHNNGDNDLDVDAVDNPNTDITGTFYQDVADLLNEGSGNYYLEIGGKLRANRQNEYGRWKFDNIQLVIANSSDKYFFRKHFTIETLGDLEYVDLWENVGDVSGAPVDFGSGVLNSTANTYGYSGSDDGWDKDDDSSGSGPFGYDDDIVYSDIVDGRLSFNNVVDNTCNNRDCSAAYGITVEITSALNTAIAGGDSVVVSFDYSWVPGSSSFEDNDHVWIKSRFSTPSGTQTYLGSDLDEGMTGSDSSNDVAQTDDPNDAFSGSFSQDITDLITEGAGNYYLEVGGKLYASANNEKGTWTIDNVQVRVGGIATDVLQKGLLDILSDDQATVYLNGEEIYRESNASNATYWNVAGASVPLEAFELGDNVIAVELVNTEGAAKFDLRLRSSNIAKTLAMLVMTDGVATEQCSEQNTGSDTGDAILAACQAREDHGITVYAVGFSDSADEATLASMASCGGGLYEKSENTSALSAFYQNVAFSILEASLQSQSVVIQGAFQRSTLYPDSHINITYDPFVTEPDVGEIELVFQTEPFNSCDPTVTIPTGIRIAEAHITSYSGEHWTDIVQVNGQTAYNLSAYSTDYITMGDPYLIQVPAPFLQTGDNTLSVNTGDGPGNSTGCSASNTLIYKAYAPSATSRTPVYSYAEGCNWTIETETAGNSTTPIPTDYSGVLTCSYTNTTTSYNTTNAAHVATHSLLQSLDFDNDGRILVSLSEDDLEIILTDVESVPYLWGPVIMRAEAWR